jgi:effector-binding domain-containing protein
MMQVLSSSETSVPARVTWHNISEDKSCDGVSRTDIHTLLPYYIQISFENYEATDILLRETFVSCSKNQTKSINNKDYVRFEVIMTVTMKNVVFWDIRT